MVQGLDFSITIAKLEKQKKKKNSSLLDLLQRTDSFLESAGKEKKSTISKHKAFNQKSFFRLLLLF